MQLRCNLYITSTNRSKDLTDQKLDQESIRFKLDANQMQSRCNKDATQKKLQFRWNLDATKMQI